MDKQPNDTKIHPRKKTSGNIIILAITTCIALIYFSFGLNSWKYVNVGDEWAAYTFAQEIVNKNFLVSPFDMQGIYSENPVLGSIYQALYLLIFPDSHIAWRMSNIVLIIPLSIFFYLWVKKLFNEKTAIVATIVLQSSFYLANFFKIGYINPQALVLFILCLYLSDLLVTTLRKKYAILLGLSLGTSFYIYIGPLFPLIIWVRFLPWLSKKDIKKKLLLLAITGAVYIPFILPGILDLSNFDKVSTRTFLHREFTDNYQIVINLQHSFSLFYKNYDYFYNHFVSGPYLEIITRIFATIGIIISVIKFRNKSYGLLLLTYCVTVIIITITQPYAYSPTTRGIFYLPFGFIFAAIGITYWKFTRNSTLILAAILITVFVSNVYRSQIGVFQETGYAKSALILKEIIDSKKTLQPTIYLTSSALEPYNITGSIEYFKSIYGLSSVPFSHIIMDNPDCSLLEGKKIIIHKSDISINQHIQVLPCKNSATFVTISPMINL